MLKKRLIPCLILKGDKIVQSIKFKRYLPIGQANIAIEFFMNWDVDEIVLLDIEASIKKTPPKYELINYFAKHCFLPLSVGGGITSLEEMRKVLLAGADKIIINQAAVRFPGLIQEGARVFGSQCIVVSIDVKINAQQEYEVAIDSGKVLTGMDPVQWAKEVENLDAGEILLNSVDRDGTKQGYDLELIRQVQEAVNIPVIACGGVGKMSHLVEGFTKANAHAVSAANIFQYTEHSTIIAKAYLKRAGIDVRLDSQVKYDDIGIDEVGRII